jgi:hypothetical protein
LESIAKGDMELELKKNPEEQEDKKINFYPIADDALSSTIANFRPNVYNKIRVRVIKNFVKFLTRKKAKGIFSKLRKDIGEENEEQMAWSNIYKILNNYYPTYTEEVEKVKMGTGLVKITKLFPEKDVDIYL